MRYRQPYSLYKRGKYYYFKTYRPDGTRTCGTSTGCTSKGMAQQFCDKLYLDGNLYHEEILFKEYAEHFFDDNSLFFKDRNRPCSINTKTNYRIHLNKQIMPYFQNKKLAEITCSNLREFRLKLKEQYCNQTVVQIMNTLKQIMNQAYIDQLINTNPFNFLKALEREESNRDAFTIDEVCQIYAEIEEEFRPIVLLTVLTGMRVSECLGMREEDFIQEKNFTYIDLKEQVNKKQRMPVKKNSFRQIPVIEEVKELIGFNLTRFSTFNNYMREYLSKYVSEDRKLTFHSFRHFFCTNAKSCGIPDIKVEYLLGHKLKGIASVYTNFKAEDCLEILQWQRETFDKITGQR